jgi:crotonobetainyl-CoA:carnitine CoA-transferase CaiB-like acyl-CoA transferase
VIAAPTATKVLAALGVDVLRVDPPGFTELPVLVADATAGKRCARLDLRDAAGRAMFAELSAYGDIGPWAGRRGFDSLIQLVTGIAAVDGADAPPRALPMQTLDHNSGWLLSAGVLEAVRRRRADGIGRRMGVVLARTAMWLDALGRLPGEQADGEPAPEESSDGAEPVTEDVDSPLGRVTRVRFPGTIGGCRPAWAGPPVELGRHPARW